MGWREAIDRLIPEIADGWECGSDVAEYILRLDEPDRIALARELLNGTDAPGEWNALMDEAQGYVRSKTQWSRWIDGTPLDNDVPVWIADFALMVLRRFACRAAMLGRSDEKTDRSAS